MRGVQPPRVEKAPSGRREGSFEVEVVRRRGRGRAKRRVSGCRDEATEEASQPYAEAEDGVKAVKAHLDIL